MVSVRICKTDECQLHSSFSVARRHLLSSFCWRHTIPMLFVTAGILRLIPLSNSASPCIYKLLGQISLWAWNAPSVKCFTATWIWEQYYVYDVMSNQVGGAEWVGQDAFHGPLFQRGALDPIVSGVRPSMPPVSMCKVSASIGIYCSDMFPRVPGTVLWLLVIIIIAYGLQTQRSDCSRGLLAVSPPVGCLAGGVISKCTLPWSSLRSHLLTVLFSPFTLSSDQSR